MASMTSVRPVSTEEYLSNPDYEKFEYIDGHVVERNVGNELHCDIQAAFVESLRVYLRQQSAGKVYPEVRCRITARGSQRFYQPDVGVVLGPRRRGVAYIEHSPDIVIEIQSPCDSVPALLRKAKDYLGDGCRLVWLVLPDDRAVLAYRPGQEIELVSAPEMLKAEDLLPGFELSLEELFA
jgi:Uma2 family endonuclease